ncbi:hypothetical protein OEZ85_003997 [Tetradesmus obliquus]|uniref:Uncharacterized protein n=1 Tax=Tetradesmus obliquus TaxID=3088 RepID=A0ABY8UG15_TETOB|nr:hypothetical protein OEZ85_003997 [Tetradesmus obliquus]
MAAESGFDACDSESDKSGSDESDDEEPDYYGFGPGFGGNRGPRYTMLRNALAQFNFECEEEGARFQWFGETFEGPLVLQEVRGNHRSGCELCNTIPGLGELFFKYYVGVHGAPWSYRKLCMTCGMGIVFAAVVELDAGRGITADEARGDSEDGLDEPQICTVDEEEEEQEDSQEPPGGQQQHTGMPPPPAAAAAAAAAAPAGSSRHGVVAGDAAEQPEQQQDEAAEPPAPKRQRR